MGSDDLDRAARELLARLEIFPATNERAWLLITSANVAALVRFAEEQRRDAIDSAFSLLIERLAPFLDDQSLHAVHAECAKIEALRHERVHRLAPPPPAPGPDARDFNPFGPWSEIPEDIRRDCETERGLRPGPDARGVCGEED